MLTMAGCSQRLETAFNERLFDQAVTGCADATPHTTDIGIQECVNRRHPEFRTMSLDQFWKRAIIDRFCRAHTLTDDDFALCVDQMNVEFNAPTNSPEEQQSRREVCAATARWEFARYGTTTPCP
jgi:hypothetical protein